MNLPVKYYIFVSILLKCNSHLTLDPLTTNYSTGIITHLKLCLADVIHNFRWEKIIQFWQNGGQQISNLAD